ncbi:MAG: protein kinase [Pirellulales bacterium]
MPESAQHAFSEDGQLAASRRCSPIDRAIDAHGRRIPQTARGTEVGPLTDRSEAIETISTDELQFAPPAIHGDLGLLGNYRIIRRLGQGGMAIVFEAVDLRLGRRVAVKVLRPDHWNKRARERFVREAQALAKIKHPGVVDIYDVADPENGPPYFVTELMHGTLRT